MWQFYSHWLIWWIWKITFKLIVIYIKTKSHATKPTTSVRQFSVGPTGWCTPEFQSRKAVNSPYGLWFTWHLSVVILEFIKVYLYWLLLLNKCSMNKSLLTSNIFHVITSSTNRYGVMGFRLHHVFSTKLFCSNTLQKVGSDDAVKYEQVVRWLWCYSY